MTTFHDQLRKIDVWNQQSTYLYNRNIVPYKTDDALSNDVVGFAKGVKESVEVMT